MPNFAVIDSGFVVNVILANSLEDAQLATGKTCVEYSDATPAGVGWSYDGTKFTAPVEEPTE